METKKLPKIFKAKWIKALRSGEYKKGTGQLYDKNDNTYCCLGIACHVVGCDEYLKRAGTRGFAVIGKRAVINVPDILKGSISDGNLVEHLVDMNDGHRNKAKSFKQIANWIEENL